MTNDAGGGPRPVRPHTHPYGHRPPGTDNTLLSGPAYSGPTATSARHAWIRTSTPTGPVWVAGLAFEQDPAERRALCAWVDQGQVGAALVKAWVDWDDVRAVDVTEPLPPAD